MYLVEVCSFHVVATKNMKFDRHRLGQKGGTEKDSCWYRDVAVNYGAPSAESLK